MFAQKKIILFITKSKIKIAHVTLGDKPKEQIIHEEAFDKDGLTAILLRNKKSLSGKVRLLLSEDFVYITTLLLPFKSNITKDIITLKAQELIPENLSETSWDFKQSLSSLPNQTTIPVQIVAAVRVLFEQLSNAFIKARVQVEAIEPTSYAIARFTKNQNKPFLFVFISEEALLILGYKSIAVATQRLTLPLNKQRIDQFISFVKERYLVEPKDVIFCGKTAGIDLKEYQTEKYKAQVQDLSPLVSLAYKEDHEGKEASILNLTLHPSVSAQAKSEAIQKTDSSKADLHAESNNPKNKKAFTKIVLIFLALTVIAALTTTLYLRSVQKKEGEIQSPKVIPQNQTPTPTPSVTSTPVINRSQYTITVLNGTTKEGEATKISALLQEQGFTVKTTGNAQSDDYVTTEIHFNERVPEEIKLPLDKLLKTIYDSIEEQKLDKNSDTDILIILGANTK